MANWIQKYKYHLQLHFIVIIYGFTGILGKLITVSSSTMVWYRMLIAFLGLGAYLFLRQHKVRANGRQLLKMLGVGLLIAIHWVLFFESIKVSTVSVALACLASFPLFIAFLEPLFFKRKIIGYEVVFGVLVILGLYLIFRFETVYIRGIVYSLLSAFFAALFTVLNAILIKENKASDITLVEMLGGVLAITVYLIVVGEFSFTSLTLSGTDLMWLLVLGLVCTSYAFVVSVDVMRELSPFTVGVTVNLEPIYSILLALLIFGESEWMSHGFYLGALIILGTVIGNAVLKNKPGPTNVNPIDQIDSDPSKPAD